ncbi:MAG: hypothetical protein Q8M44_03490 [bacterium]|nr:hypothetical protein [bacterium]
MSLMLILLVIGNQLLLHPHKLLFILFVGVLGVIIIVGQAGSTMYLFATQSSSSSHQSVIL